MSILFEAWRRARGKESRLAETLGAPPVVSASRRSLVPWLLCIVLAAIAVGLAVYLWRTHGPRPVHTVAATAAGESSPPGQPAHPAAAIASAPKKTVAAAPRPLSPSVSAPAVHPAVAANAGSQDEQRQAIAPAAQRSIATNPGSDTGTAEQEVSQASIASPPPQPPDMVPVGGAAPDDVREALPPFTVTVHVWNEDPAKRFIMIGGRVYRPGDEITSGVQLLDVTQSGEIVGFRGYRIELPSG